MNNITCDLAPFSQTLNTCSHLHSTVHHVQLSIVEMSIHRYFRSKVNLPTPSQAQLSPNVLREVNQAVTAALEREELGNQASKVLESENTTRLSCLKISLLLSN